MTKDALAQPEQEQTGIREIRVTETVKQEQESVGEVNRHGRYAQPTRTLTAN